ncbi:MAG: MalY/PatB family protein [Lachnospiraceae bacterium]
MEERNLDFDTVVERRNTDCLKYDFAVRRGRPENVLPLWVADMDFKTSSLILDAIINRVEHGIFGYSEVGESYFNAVAGWLLKHHGMDIKSNWLVKTPGVVFALAMAVKAYTDEGDAVLIQQPVYYPFKEVIEDNKRVVVSSDLVLGQDGKYGIDYTDFEKKIVDNNVKLFLFCSPHNPVGRVWTKEELKKIGDICLAHNVIVVSDEIHEDFVYENHKHIPFITTNEKLKDYCITCTSPAKTFNLAGLQISNIIIPNAGLRHAFKREINAAGYSQLNTIGLVACEAAYTYGEEWHAQLMKYLKSNLDYVREFLKNRLPKVKLIEPEGTYLVWLDFRQLKLAERELEDLIVNKAGLWLDSGAIFGSVGEGFERINIATSRKILEEAFEKLARAVGLL